ncbi:putative Zn-dependent peptidase [Actinoplanes octamycinicus]|uniref:Putative Zn-dependent peptidase n=1 Tax=Actinoplanes octamycinicus TaxID=135948 RepID=A0A7W7GTK2_9ACTN|nr:hypothetical protein [Actinoplanes octamycinicus]MBB4737977.1 putative Zn-dependent peptidase [Actinoplanes octamycinicus]GIE58973.1 hypothetical protein Aoc01nite_43750 [Actinoplanes octamycinicus]
MEPGWLQSFPDQLREVTPEGIADVAQELYDPARFAGVVVGRLPDLTTAGWQPAGGA